MTFNKGDIVIVSPSITTPKFGWGSVDRNDVGVYIGCDDSPGEVLVDFPNHEKWHCMSYELTLVSGIARIERPPGIQGMMGPQGIPGRNGENNMKTRAGTSWSFGSVSTLDIDYQEIGRELCKANPLALIEAIGGESDSHGIMVHDSLAIKAKVCDLPDPNDGISHVTMPGIGYVSRCAIEDFSQWIAWAKIVKGAKWPIEYHRKAKVTVTLAKV